jgi:hypothetical protein
MADLTLFKKVYRIFTWVTFAGLILTIVLVLRKSPAPQVPYDPNAAARAEQKFEAAGQAKASGQPAQVQLDRSELNSYLAQNLQLEGQATAPSTPSGTPGSAPAANPTNGVPEIDQPTLEQVQSSVKDVKVEWMGML